MLIIAHVQFRFCNPAILQYYVITPDDRRFAEVPSAGALLAVCRVAGAADRGGARVARSGPARGAVRRAAAAVLDLAGVPAARRPGVSRRARYRACRV